MGHEAVNRAVEDHQREKRNRPKKLLFSDVVMSKSMSKSLVKKERYTQESCVMETQAEIMIVKQPAAAICDDNPGEQLRLQRMLLIRQTWRLQDVIKGNQSITSNARVCGVLHRSRDSACRHSETSKRSQRSSLVQILVALYLKDRLICPFRADACCGAKKGYRKEICFKKKRAPFTANSLPGSIHL